MQTDSTRAIPPTSPSRWLIREDKIQYKLKSCPDILIKADFAERRGRYVRIYIATYRGTPIYEIHSTSSLAECMADAEDYARQLQAPVAAEARPVWRDAVCGG